MSQFFSDLLTLTTASVVCGAAALGSISLEAEPRADAHAELAVAAVEVPDADLSAPLRGTGPATAVVEVADIPQAKLIQVSFTSTEDELFPELASARAAAFGTVLGSTVNLRAGPGTGFAVAGRAVRDQSLAVTGERDGAWVQVLAEGVTEPVWIHGKFFRAP